MCFRSIGAEAKSSGVAKLRVPPNVLNIIKYPPSTRSWWSSTWWPRRSCQWLRMHHRFLSMCRQFQAQSRYATSSIHTVEYEELHRRHMEDYNADQLHCGIHTSEHHRANL
jgi:hypothetical protein